jgi:hypothetical protein
MKPDLSQSDFAGLVLRSEELAARTRAHLGLTRDEAPSGTPFDCMLRVLVQFAEIFAVAVVVVVLIALACAGGSKP